MIEVNTPEVVQDDYGNLQFATEVAYAALIARAIKDGLLPMPINPPFDEFPDEAAVQAFKDACKSIISILKAAETQTT